MSTANKAVTYIVTVHAGRSIRHIGEVIQIIETHHGEVLHIGIEEQPGKEKTAVIRFMLEFPEHYLVIEQALLSLALDSGIQIADEITHLHLGGKLESKSRNLIRSMEDLSKVYTPGVAQVCMEIARHPEKVYDLTIKKNTVAVISDGTAVLGLGDIGPEAAMPVMEGKAVLFKQFAGVDAFPICLNTKDTEEIIAIVKALAPTFGGINLEDISAPRCFEIEARLKAELDIPVFHDDQHGTAVVVLAGFLNAIKLCGKSIGQVKVVVNGAGAAGIAVSKMLLNAGVVNLIGVDRHGAIHRGEQYANAAWNEFARISNPGNLTGPLSSVIDGADVFIGLSGPNVLKVEDLQRMAKDSIVFAMANPIPEIAPEVAAPYVRVMATGRSDYPNQLNNVLCFPGIFRGALDCGAREINEDMKLAVAHAIASAVADHELNETYIIPNLFNSQVVERIRQAVAETAYKTGVIRTAASPEHIPV